MNFEYSDKVVKLQKKLNQFMEEVVFPNEKTYHKQMEQAENRWVSPPIMEEMKGKAKAAGLWNLFLEDPEYGAGLTNLEYAPLCEIMGRSPIAPEVFNCHGPNAPNIEMLVLYGTEEQKEKWLPQLLNGEILSCFSMTEPRVASSDALNIETSIIRDGDQYVINGRKWWSSGAASPNCKFAIVLGKSSTSGERHKQHSMVIVPLDTPGVKIIRTTPVFGYDRAPIGHAEIEFENVRVPVTNILVGEGEGFAIAQGRLGPARIQHCMRSIGTSERALEIICQRSMERVTFGKPLSEQGVVREWIANSRIDIEQARLLVLKAAYMIDKVGNKAAKKEIAMIKVAVPNMSTKVLDRAIQILGGAGVTDDFPIAHMWTHERGLRIYDGPDEVHRATIAKWELKDYL
ncbi:acyl-CoA dehydrogenase [Neobacillus niacini]|uniref:acyl-CoA dehydrogenase family protein n=1 Tax=Neobacillus niacini TaxID=86668 RepID=UPI00285BE7BA|nr:acyl-CoA dehydrogenase family protein [Neobacillus niacini]MDR7075761.1 acyl-CoA dehydrogenase [Neobacillus niacini]